MNLKRGALLSVAALMVGTVALVACTRGHEDRAQDEAAMVDECNDQDEAPAAMGDDTSTTVFAGRRGGDRDDGPDGPDDEPGWGLGQGPGGDRPPPGYGGDGPPQGWDSGEAAGPRQAWGEGRGRRGHGRGHGGQGRGRRGHRRGRRGGNGGNGRGRWPGGRGQGQSQGPGQGQGRRSGSMEREIRPWLRALIAQLMEMAQGERGREEGPPEMGPPGA